MENIFCLKKQRIHVNPTAHILKAHEYVTLMEANDILRAAEEHAARMREEAQKAFEEERVRGYEEGLEEGREEMADRTFEAIAKGIDFIESLEKTTVDIVMKSLQRVFDEIPPEESVLRVVRRALSYVRGQNKVVMRVCPQEVSWVQQEIVRLSNEAFGVESIRVVPDKSLGPSACVLESDLGIVDASLSVQIAALRRVFDGHLKKV